MERIAELKKKAQKLSDEGSRKYREAGVIEEEIDSIKRDIIKEKKLLSKSPWKAKFYGDILYLENLEADLPEVTKIIGGDYHFSFRLTDNEILSFDDGEIRIRFDYVDKDLSPEGLMEFVMEWDLKVDWSSINREITPLEKSLEVLRKLQQQISEES